MGLHQQCGGRKGGGGIRECIVSTYLHANDGLAKLHLEEGQQGHGREHRQKEQTQLRQKPGCNHGSYRNQHYVKQKPLAKDRGARTGAAVQILRDGIGLINRSQLLLAHAIPYALHWWWLNVSANRGAVTMGVGSGGYRNGVGGDMNRKLATTTTGRGDRVGAGGGLMRRWLILGAAAPLESG